MKYPCESCLKKFDNKDLLWDLEADRMVCPYCYRKIGEAFKINVPKEYGGRK